MEPKRLGLSPFVVIALLTVSCAIAEPTVVYNHIDPKFDEGRIYATSHFFDPGVWDLNNFTVSYDDTNAYFALTFRGMNNKFAGFYGFSMQMCQIYVDADRRFGSGSSDSDKPASNSNADVDPEYPFEFFFQFTGWYTFGKSIPGYLGRADEKMEFLRPYTVDTTIITPLPLTFTGIPQDDWAYTVWCGSENFGKFRQVNAKPEEWVLGGGDDGFTDPNIVEILAPPNVNKTDIWNMYKTERRTIVPAIGNDIFFNTLVFEATDKQKDERGSYPLIAGIKPGTFDITNFKVFQSSKYIVFRTQLANMTENAKVQNNFDHLLLHIYVDTDNKFLSGVRDSLADASFAIADEKGWDFAITLDGTTAKFKRTKTGTNEVITPATNFVVYASNNIVQISVPIADLQGLGGVSDPSKWGFIVCSGYSNKHELLPFASKATATSFGGGLDSNADANVVDILDFDNLEQDKILGNSVAQTQGKTSIQFMTQTKRAFFVLTKQTDASGDERGTYPTSSIFTPWTGTKGLFDLVSFETSSDDLSLRFKIEIRDLVSDNGADGSAQVLSQVYIDADNIFGSGRIDSIGNSNMQVHPKNAWDVCLTMDLQQSRIKSVSAGGEALHTGLTVQGSYIVAYVPLLGLQLPPPKPNWSFIVFTGGRQSAFTFRSFRKSSSESAFGGGDDLDFDPNIVDLLIPSGASQESVLGSFNNDAGQKAFAPAVGALVQFRNSHYLVKDSLNDEYGTYPTSTVYSPSSGLFDLNYFSVESYGETIYFSFDVREMFDHKIQSASDMGLLGVQIYVDKDRVHGSGETAPYLNPAIQLDPQYGWEHVIHVSTEAVTIASKLASGNFSTSALSKTVSGKAVIVEVPKSIIGMPSVSWAYTVISGAAVMDGGKSQFVIHNTFESTLNFGLGDDSSFDPNICDVILPSDVNQAVMLASYSMMRKQYAQLSPVGYHVHYGTTVWSQADPKNDERGTYPTNFPATRGIMDIVDFKIGTFSSKLWMRISMAALSVPGGDSAFEFQHTLLSIYADIKSRGVTGSTQVVSNEEATLPSGFQWTYHFMVSKSGVNVKIFDGSAKALAVGATVRVEGTTLVVEMDWSGQQAPKVDWTYVVLSGGEAQTANTFASVNAQAGLFVFGSGLDSKYDSNIIDMLVAPGVLQKDVFESYSVESLKSVILSAVGGSVYEKIYSAQDASGDEYGEYPLHPVFGGTAVKGWMDMTMFEVRRNATHVEFDVEFAADLGNPDSLSYGFTFPIVTFYIHSGDKDSSLREDTVDKSFVNLDTPWVAAVKLSGHDIEIFYSETAENSATAFMNRSEIYRHYKLNNRKLQVSVLADALGEVTNNWSYTVISGLYDPVADDYVVRNKEPSYRRLGGGDDDYYDPNIVDIIIPLAQRRSGDELTVSYQNYLMTNYDVIKKKKSTVPAVGPAKEVDFSVIPESNSEQAEDGGEDNSALIGGVVGGIAGLIVVVGIVVGRRYRARLQHMQEREKQLFVHVKYEDIEFDKLLGVGSFGEVFKGRWRGTEVAVKRLNFKKLNKEALDEFNHEVQVMVELRHPNLVLYMGACVEQPNLCIISELMSRGSLYDVLHDPTIDMDVSMKMSLLADAAKGLQYLHMSNPPILHRDLKSPNLLLDIRWNLKVSDFGLSGVKNQGPKSDAPPGTLFWMAPEVMNGDEYTTAADVYSYAIIMWEVFTRMEPYQGEVAESVAFRVRKDGFRPPVPNSEVMASAMQKLMQDAWAQNISQRPSFTTILNEIRTVFDDRNSSGTFSASGTMSKTSSSKQKEPAPTGKIALVFTDVQGSTSLWEHYPEEMSVALSTHNEIMRGLIQRNKGYEVKTEGDAFMVTFPTVKNALTFTLQAQEMLLSSDWPAPMMNHKAMVQVASGGIVIFKGIRVRMGVHFGEPLCKEDPVTGRMDYFGQVVNKAARVGGYPQGGQIAISDSAYEEIQSELDSLGRPAVRDLGEHMLKGITTSTRLYEVLPATLADRSRIFASKDDGDNSITDMSSTQGGHSWQLNFEDITMSDKELGAGSFGVVFLGELRGERVAVKKFMKQKMEEKRYFSFLAEIMLLREVSHPAILKFHGASVKPPNICLVIEYAEHGSLKDVLFNPRVPLNSMQQKAILAQCADAMKYLHQRQPPVIHRDLKSANVMVCSLTPIVVKLGDFGLARVKADNQTMTKCGTRAWLAPEILKGQRYTEKADVFSFGIMMWEVVSRDRPYANQDPLRLNLEIVNGLRPTPPRNAEAALVQLMNKCWDGDEKARPGFAEIHDSLVGM